MRSAFKRALILFSLVATITTQGASDGARRFSLFRLQQIPPFSYCARFIGAKSAFDLDRFRVEKTEYAAFFSSGGDELPKDKIPATPEQSLALVEALAESLGYDFVSLPENDAEARKVLDSVGIGKIAGALGDGEKLPSPVRFQRVLERIYARSLQQRLLSERAVPRPLGLTVEDLSQVRVETALLRVRALPELAEALSQLGLVRNPGLLDKIRSDDRWRVWVDYANFAAVNAAMVFQFGFPLLYPMTSPSHLRRPSSEILDFFRKNGWDSTWERYRPQLERWGWTEQTWRIGKKVYLTTVSAIAVTAVVVLAPWAKTAWSARQAAHNPAQAQEEARKWEEAHYNSEQVVQEQYDAWAESLPSPPTDEQKQKKLTELRDQEKRGLFRIYSR